MARELGISHCYLQRIEMGTCNSAPSEDVLRRMADYLGINLSKLFADAGRLPEGVKNYILASPAELARLMKKAGVV
jgi:transcriptional regulator with XRE-family HTH domain